MAKYKLPDEVKRRIVTELASFSTTNEIKDMLTLEYGLDMDLQDIIRYDATKSYCISGETLKALFHQVRKEYSEGVADLHVANLGYRLRRLMAMSMKAEKQGNMKLAAELLEQAAKDHGGAFTNVRQIDGRFQHQHLTPDQARKTIEGYLVDRKAEAKRLQTKH